MKLQVICEHTFDVDALPPGAVVLDVGCRDFMLTQAFLDRGCRVVAMDPDPNIKGLLCHPQFTMVRKALVSYPVARQHSAILHVPDDPYGAYIQHDSNPVRTIVTNANYEVELIDILSLSNELEIPYWTAVKLDCEGSEYEILLDWPGPIAGQISVEFHDHLHGKDMTETYQQIHRHLGQWYAVHQWKRSGRKPASRNYWDVLFTLNDP
jgi:FkbM family methyltransferase